jgi:hypothetical protein
MSGYRERQSRTGIKRCARLDRGRGVSSGFRNTGTKYGGRRKKPNETRVTVYSTRGHVTPPILCPEHPRAITGSWTSSPSGLKPHTKPPTIYLSTRSRLQIYRLAFRSVLPGSEPSLSPNRPPSSMVSMLLLDLSSTALVCTAGLSWLAYCVIYPGLPSQP